MPNVVKIQSGYKVQPLSSYLHQPAPPPPPRLISQRSSHPPTNERLAKVKAEVGKETKPSQAEGKRTKRFEQIVKI